MNDISVKKKYIKFLKSQEVLSEPFRNKIQQFNQFYLPVSEIIFKKYLKDKKTKIISLTGGQGSGKSTIANILKIILKEKFNLRTVLFSIDDFYKTLKSRTDMSLKVSPLFLTRGVPGTHDTTLLNQCMKNLKRKKFKKILIPRFDKSIDDRLKKKIGKKLIKDQKLLFLKVGALVLNHRKKKIY